MSAAGSTPTDKAGPDMARSGTDLGTSTADARSDVATAAPIEAGIGLGVPRESRGTIALDPSACTSCMLCARECPDWCIHIDSHAETESGGDAPGARPRTVHVLDRFAIDFGLCLYCGICIDVCPFDALVWVPVPTVPSASAAGLVHEMDALAAMWPTSSDA